MSSKLSTPAVFTPEQFVAHRGLQSQYVENSLSGFQAAILAGALHVEMDIQLSKDGIAMLYHDVTLDRVSGIKGSIFDFACSHLTDLPASEPIRLGDRYASQTIAPLYALGEIAKQHPYVTFYIELKEDSIVRHGLDTCLSAIKNAVETFHHQCVLISFDPTAVLNAKQHFGFSQTGLVFRHWSKREALYAETHADIAYINYKRIRSTRITSSVPLVVYEVANPTLAKTLLQRGVAKIETFAIDRLIESLCQKT
ncbi:Uncharacterised protein [BD1-7 clade bacterium]|uniref:GP-PDE domain-containing protein n=1 Tax=BD1-7 clade bacterium TaxID=2029982 RepID=A0A5S9MXZ3_9GAMM|nr:Uncharacterised protein [BD1-7 clade bacterium]CAA0082816.1 Uncharacterised protein [BD1-7 clade bacterium]